MPNLRSAPQLPDIPVTRNGIPPEKKLSKQVFTSSSYTTEASPMNRHNTSFKFDELSIEDFKICDKLRISHETFISVRTSMVTESQRRNGIKASDIRKLLKMDVNKTTKLYYYFLDRNLIYKPSVDSNVERIGDFFKPLNLHSTKSTSSTWGSTINDGKSITASTSKSRTFKHHLEVV